MAVRMHPLPGNEQREKHIYTVSEITRYIRVILEDSFPGIWIQGEISNFVLHSSGHMYFSLRDAQAVIKCAMFRRANERLKFKPANGMQVICCGALSVYEARGDYQLIVEEIEPKGVGALELQFQQLKEKLHKEGLFDESHKIAIPFLPTRIGIVTSPTGAAIRDILTVARRRFSNIEIIISPVKVQGDGAAQEIAQAITQLDTLNIVDVIIAGRGGGSLEDLWPFNEEVVARSIYQCRTPIISAVGHEIDYTIADFVADVRAPTPSAAAEMVIPRKDDLVQGIATTRARLRAALGATVATLTERYARARTSYALRQPLAIVTQYEQRIDDLGKSAGIAIDHLVALRREEFRRMAATLDVLSPLAILGRGYSITTKLPGGEIVKDARHLAAGDRIATKLGTGTVESTVAAITKE